jgi:tetratricopeptide (TPR) repeat protein
MRRYLMLAAAPLVLLSACATAGGAPSSAPDVTAIGGTSPYGMYLAGEAALNDGRSAEAARYFDQARAHPEADSLIAERAFSAALMAGDVQRAASMAPTGETASEASKRLGKLVVAVEALAAGKGKAAQTIFASNEITFPHRSAAALLAPWAAAQAGDTEGSLVTPLVRGDRMVEYFGKLGQALLFERARRYDEAETDFKAITSAESAGEMAILAHGGFLERRGRRLEAVALYESALGRESGSKALMAAKARAANGKSAPPAPSIREGAAQALLAPAATMIASRQTQTALSYLRLVLRLDPQRDDAWLMVGDLMQAAGDPESARLAYSKPKPGSAEFATAQSKLAWTYESAGDHETALKLARTAAASGGAEARLTLADLLRANDQFAEAAELLSGLIRESDTPDWRLHYARGVTLERLDRWKEAEADLQVALKARPDEPELLNYLGYSWIDRGERLPEALAMVEKAVAANPQSGAMVDSLGWAHYRLGDYKKAVEKLEQAVELEAGDPDINNHLGDAYWKVGRRDEAQFQWRRVLTLNPDPKSKANAEAKLASGLGPDGPAPKLAGQ